ncbi:MAG: MATE family efflux transporter [Oligosphaeraceae bacterium]|nr:MATE family efflux transporter [Oligosphaeraceae bacterium]
MSSILTDRSQRSTDGIAALIPIALPMIISNIFDTVMMFVDRLYLAYVGKEHMAACMNAGLTSGTCTVFFAGVASYVSAMVARSYGARQFSQCPRIVYQGMRFALFSYPLVLLIGLIAINSFTWAGHSNMQIQLEETYFRWMLFGGTLLSLLRTPLASFFSGIGKTSVIMKASFVSMLVNLLFNYLLIYGKFGFPRLEINGAAIGTLLASLVLNIILAIAFQRETRSKEYRSVCPWRFDAAISKTLLKFGIPTGMDYFLSTSAFNLTIAVFHGYGADAAAAVTIVMNWDLLAFFPLQGVQVAITTLVGQNLGAKNIPAATRTAYSGCKLNLLYSLFILLIFLGMPSLLVSIFTPESGGIDYSQVKKLAVPMLRWAGFYLIFDSVYISFSGALRGGGDTLWAMIIGLIFHWSLAINVLLTTYLFKFSLMGSWIVWVLSSVTGGTLIYWRFRTGKWKHIKLSSNENEAEEIDIASQLQTSN